MPLYLDDRFPGLPERPRNTTVNWYGSDHKQNYLNYQPNPYTADEISYTFNAQGFRCDEFTSADKNILFLGCSITEGVGLPGEQVWARLLWHQIQTATGLHIPYYNLGLQGCGFDSATRAVCVHEQMLKPDIIFALLPPYRKEWRRYNISTGWRNITADNSSVFEKNPWLLEQCNIAYEYEKNFHILDLIGQKHQTLILWDTWDTDFPDIDEHYGACTGLYHSLGAVSKQKARDGKHPGAAWHKAYSDAVWKKYQTDIIKKLVGTPGIEPGQEP